MRTSSGVLLVVLSVPAFLTTILGRPAGAFHSGGIGECSGCHSLHNSSGSPGDNPFLLAADDPSSTCLTCHQQAGDKVPTGYHVATDESDMPAESPPVHLTPGGDFGWLKKNYQWNRANGTAGGHSPGERHGHNIVASAYGFAADSTRMTAPGGTYPAADLSCTGCHDPHGTYRRLADGTIQTTGQPVQGSGSYETSPDPTALAAVGVYRLLGGKGYARPSGGGEPFRFDPPAAVSPFDYNRAETKSDTRVAYGSGMSEWCVNCHNTFTGSGNAPGHPAGNLIKISPRLIANYNAYIASGNTSGNSSTSYTTMVPFEMGTSDYLLMKRTARSDGSMTAGPDTGSNVTCLTCHRAHASAWDAAARWNMKAEFLVYNGEYPGADRTDVPAQYSQGRTKEETRQAFYDRPAGVFATYQRSLCNKCHTLD
jgi:predicted CXXCH cytochrome family protein